jgi:transposase-like protein
VTKAKTDYLPETLMEAVRYFSDLDVCTEFVAALRWQDGPICPSCSGTEHSYLKTRRLWKCKNKACHRQFSVKVGTIFKDSPLALDKWLVSIWLIANSKNGISSYELSRSVGITQKSAWFVLQRIRLAMQTGSFDKLSGIVEADETFIGGKAANMHASRKAQKIHGTGAGKGSKDKSIVSAVVERGGEVRGKVIGNLGYGAVQDIIRENVEPGSTVHTDALQSYRSLTDDYKHEWVDHHVQYVVGQVHTNTIENFWSLLKRGLYGTYVRVSPEHLSRYLDERIYAFNTREQDDLPRFAGVVQQVSGRRLTWRDLIGSEG